jgi:hypothetical protein
MSPVGPEGRARGEGFSGGEPEVVRVWLLGGFRVSVGGRTSMVTSGACASPHRW